MSQLKMIHGDTFAFDVTVSDASGPINITGGVLIFTMKKAFSDADVAAVAQKKSSSGGIVITNASQGIARVTISSSDTSSLTNVWQVLVWDVQLVLSGNVYTVATGSMEVQPEVTVSLS